MILLSYRFFLHIFGSTFSRSPQNKAHKAFALKRVAYPLRTPSLTRLNAIRLPGALYSRLRERDAL